MDLNSLQKDIVKYKELQSERKKVTEKMSKLKDKIIKQTPQGTKVKIGYHSSFWSYSVKRGATIADLHRVLPVELFNKVVTSRKYVRFEVGR